MKGIPLIQTVAQQLLASGLTPNQGVRELWKAMIAESLREHKGNVCRTARALHLHRNTLSRKLAELQIADVATECRAELARARELRFGSRLPLSKMEARRSSSSRSSSSSLADAGDRSRVA